MNKPLIFHTGHLIFTFHEMDRGVKISPEVSSFMLLPTIQSIFLKSNQAC